MSATSLTASAAVPAAPVERQPLHLKRLSGEILTIYPEGAQDPRDLAFLALPEGERPAHVGKLRILPSEDPEEPATLWMDAPEYSLQIDLLGSAFDRQTCDEYALGLVLIMEDQITVFRRYFYFHVQDRFLYRHQEVIVHPRSHFRDEDEIEIPATAQPILPSEFLPVEWSSKPAIQEDWETSFTRFSREVTGEWVEDWAEDIERRVREEERVAELAMREEFME